MRARVKVSVRIRPSLPGEIDESQGGYYALAHAESSSNWLDVRRVNPRDPEGSRRKAKERIPLMTNSDDEDDDENEVRQRDELVRSFADSRLHFNRVWGPATSGDEVFRSVGVPTVDDLFEGFHGCIFVYGQTSTGKTYTLCGPEVTAISSPTRSSTSAAADTANPQGLLPFCLKYIFEKRRRLAETHDFVVRHHYVQIYRDTVLDLLKQGPEALEDLPLRVNDTHGAVVEGAVMRESNSYEESMRIVREGDSNRVVCNTQLNTQSSRSHAVFITDLYQRRKKEKRSPAGAEEEEEDERDTEEGSPTSTSCGAKKDRTVSSRLFLVDLAGSERIKKSRAEGEAYKDAVAINKSLTALGSCVNALANDGKVTSFRETKLTRLLQNPISGNGKTQIVVTLRPDSNSLSETISTLQFARRAQRVEAEMTASEYRRLLIEKHQEVQDSYRALADLVARRHAAERHIEREQIPVMERIQQLKGREISINDEIKPILEKGTREKKVLEDKFHREEKDIAALAAGEAKTIREENNAYAAEYEHEIQMAVAPTVQTCTTREQLLQAQINMCRQERATQHEKLDQYEEDFAAAEGLPQRVGMMMQDLHEEIRVVKRQIRQCCPSPNAGKEDSELKARIDKAKALLLPLQEKRQRLLQAVRGWDLEKIQEQIQPRQQDDEHQEGEEQEQERVIEKKGLSPRFRQPTDVELAAYAEHIKAEITSFPLMEKMSRREEGLDVSSSEDTSAPSSSLPSSWFETESSSSGTAGLASPPSASSSSRSTSFSSYSSSSTNTSEREFFERARRWARSPIPGTAGAAYLRGVWKKDDPRLREFYYPPEQSPQGSKQQQGQQKVGFLTGGDEQYSPVYGDDSSDPFFQIEHEANPLERTAENFGGRADDTVRTMYHRQPSPPPHRAVPRKFFDKMLTEEQDMVTMRKELQSFLAGQGTTVYLVTPPGPAAKIPIVSIAAQGGAESPLRKRAVEEHAGRSSSDHHCLAVPSRESAVITPCVMRMEGEKDDCQLFLRSVETEGAKSSYIVNIPFDNIDEILLGQDSRSFSASVEHCPSVAFGTQIPKTSERITWKGLRLFFYRSLTLLLRHPLEGISSGPEVPEINLVLDSDADFETWTVGMLFATGKEATFGAPLDLTGCGTRVDELTGAERRACEELHIQPETFLQCRRRLLEAKQHEKLMYITPVLLRQTASIDLLHALKLLSFFAWNGEVEVADVHYTTYREWLTQKKAQEFEKTVLRDLRQRIVQMFRQYRPTTTNSVLQQFLKKVSGRERETLNELIEEYGPEPGQEADDEQGEGVRPAAQQRQEEVDLLLEFDDDELAEETAVLLEGNEVDAAATRLVEHTFGKQRIVQRQSEAAILQSDKKWEEEYYSSYMRSLIRKATREQNHPSSVRSIFSTESLAAKVENVRRSMLCNEHLQSRFAQFVEPDCVSDPHLLSFEDHYSPALELVDQFVNGVTLAHSRSSPGTAVKTTARRRDNVLLLTGIEGTGKSTLALFLMQYYLCGVDLNRVNQYLLLSSTTRLSLSNVASYTIPESPGKCAFIPVYIHAASIFHPMTQLLEEGLSKFLGIDLSTDKQDPSASDSGVLSLSALQERVPFLFIIDGVDEVQDPLLAEAFPTPNSIPSTSHLDKYRAMIRVYHRGMTEEEEANLDVDGDEPRVNGDEESEEDRHRIESDSGGVGGNPAAKKKVKMAVSTARLFGSNKMHRWAKSKFIFTARHMGQTECISGVDFYTFLKKFVAPATQNNPAVPDLSRVSTLILCPFTERKQSQFLLRSVRLVPRNAELFGEGFPGVNCILAEMKKLSKWHLYMQSPELLSIFVSVVPHILARLAAAPETYADKISLLSLIELYIEKDVQSKLERLGKQGVPLSIQGRETHLLLSAFCYDSALAMAHRGSSALVVGTAIGGRPVIDLPAVGEEREEKEEEEDANPKEDREKKSALEGVRQEQQRTSYVHQSAETLFYRTIGPFQQSPLFNPLPLQNKLALLGVASQPWMTFSDEVIFESRLIQSYYFSVIMARQLSANPMDENNIINRVFFGTDEQLMALVFCVVGQESLMEVLHLVQKKALSKKKEQRLHIAVANALSTLVFNNVPFSKFDFSQLNLSCANMRYGMFDYASFEDAILTGCNFRGAQLNHAMLAGAHLREATVKEWAPIKDSDMLSALVWAPNGKFVAVGGFSNSVGFYEASTARFTGIALQGHEDCVTDLVLSPDGSILVSASEDETARVWDAQSGRFLKALKGHIGPVNAVAVSGDGRIVATAGEDELVVLWDTQSGSKLASLDGHKAPVLCLCFAFSGRSLISGAKNGRVIMWEVPTTSQLSDFGAHSSAAIYTVAIASSGKILATGSEDKTIVLYNRTGEPRHRLRGHTRAVLCVHFSPKSDVFLCSASADRTVRVWDTRFSCELRCFYDHLHEVRKAFFNPDGLIIASVSCDRTCRFHEVNLDSVSCVTHEADRPDPIFFVSVHDATRILTVSQTLFQVWDIDTCETLVRYEAPSSLLVRFITACIPAGLPQQQDVDPHHHHHHSPTRRSKKGQQDRPRLLLGCSDGVIRLVEQKALHSATAVMVGKAAGHEGPVASLHSVYCASFVSASADGSVKLWESTKPLSQLSEEEDEKEQFALMRKKRSSRHHSNKRTRIQQQQQEEPLDFGNPYLSILTDDPVTIVLSSPNEDFLLTSSGDRRIQKVRTSDGNVLGEFIGHKGMITALILSEDSALLVSGANDHLVKVWQTDRVKEVRSLSGHQGPVTALAISTDAQEVFSGSTDMSIRIWDVATAEQRYYIPTHPVASLAVSADLKVIISGGFDGAVRVIQKLESSWCTVRMLGPRKLTGGNAFGVVGLREVHEVPKSMKHFLLNAKSGISASLVPQAMVDDGEEATRSEQ